MTLQHGWPNTCKASQGTCVLSSPTPSQPFAWQLQVYIRSGNTKWPSRVPRAGSQALFRPTQSAIVVRRCLLIPDVLVQPQMSLFSQLQRHQHDDQGCHRVRLHCAFDPDNWIAVPNEHSPNRLLHARDEMVAHTDRCAVSYGHVQNLAICATCQHPPIVQTFFQKQLAMRMSVSYVIKADHYSRASDGKIRTRNTPLRRSNQPFHTSEYPEP